MINVNETSTAICPACEKIGTIEKITQREALTVRGKPIEFDAEVRRCSNCGEVFANVDEEQANFTKAYRAYRQRHGLLQPEEIREIREQYGLGQRAFSRLLGWGEITVHRYEAGALQDEIHNNELLLLKDPKNFQVLFERNRERLPNTVSRSVEEKLPELVNTEMRGQFRLWVENFFGQAREDLLSGYRRFDLERFETIVLYLCSSVKEVTKTKLNKLLWYSDFLNFRLTHRSLTGIVYVHLPYGPVPQNYECCLAHLTDQKLLDSQEEVTWSGFTFEVYKPREKADLSSFAVGERAVLAAISKRFATMKAKRIVEISHREAGYEKTSQGKSSPTVGLSICDRRTSIWKPRSYRKVENMSSE